MFNVKIVLEGISAAHKHSRHLSVTGFTNESLHQAGIDFSNLPTSNEMILTDQFDAIQFVLSLYRAKSAASSSVGNLL